MELEHRVKIEPSPKRVRVMFSSYEQALQKRSSKGVRKRA
jgi:hypothetical protein